MPFDLDRIATELEETPPMSPHPVELAAAVVNDMARLAGCTPPPPAYFEALDRSERTRAKEQLSMLAHLLAHTSLRDASVEALRAEAVDLEAGLEALFEAIEPLTAEMIRSHPMRREELLRRWVQCCGGTVAGETKGASRARLEKLDYRASLAELEEAEQAREKEAARRRKLVEEAKAKETAARGWRE